MTATLHRISVVSDTHGLLRPELLPLLAGSDHILHLGDVGDAEILEALEQIAPVTAIRGNIDATGECAQLPETEVVHIAGHDLYLLHDVGRLDLEPSAAGFSAVLYGHSHKPEIRTHKGVLYFNPGSCGPRRFQLPICCGQILVEDAKPLEARILMLTV
jgi:putative phosphoesterase